MSLKKNVIANYFGAGWTALMTFAFVPFYIRYLGIEAYGLIGVYTMLQAWLSLLDLGMTPALSRELAGLGGDRNKGRMARDLLRSIEVIFVAVASMVVVAIWASSYWLASEWLSSRGVDPRILAQALTLMGVVIGLRLVENIYRSSVVGLQRQVALSAVTVIMATLRGLGAVAVLVFVAPTIQAYFLWQCLVSVLSVAALAATAYRALPPALAPARFSGEALRTVWRFAAGTMFITFLSLLLTQIDKVLLSRLLTLEAFGYYAFAVVVAQLPIALVAPVTQAFFPRFAELLKRDDQAGLAKAYHAACQLITVLLGSATALLMLFGQEILVAWTGDAALSARTYPLVRVIALGSLLNGLMTAPYFLQLSSGWTRLTIRVNLVAIALVVPALFLVVPRQGAIGAAWIWVGLNAFYLFVVIPLMHRRLLPGEKWRWFLRDVGLPLAAALTAAWLASELVPGYSARPLVAIKLLCCGVFVVAAATLAAPIVRAQLVAHAPARLRLRAD